MRNSFKNPRAFFTTKEAAFNAATCINDRFRGYYAGYRRLDDHLWVVEATGVDLPSFVKALSACGCDGWV